MGKVALKLNGKPFTLRPESAALAKVLKFLQNSATDDLFGTQELMAHARCSRTVLTAWSDELLPYRFQIANKMYWGNPRAIAELKRQVGA